MISILDSIKKLKESIDDWVIRDIYNALDDIKYDLWGLDVDDIDINTQIKIYDLAELLDDNDEVMKLSINGIKDILNKIQIALEGLI